MTKNEYEEKIIEISGQLDDLSNLIDDLSKEIIRIIRSVEYLPEISDLSEDKKDEE